MITQTPIIAPESQAVQTRSARRYPYGDATGANGSRHCDEPVADPRPRLRSRSLPKRNTWARPASATPPALLHDGHQIGNHHHYTCQTVRPQGPSHIEMHARRTKPLALGFPVPPAAGTVRSPNNFRRQWRDAREGSGYEGLTPHVSPKTVATIIDREYGSKDAATRLDHSGSASTEKHYIEKSATAPGLTRALKKSAASPRPREPSTPGRPNSVGPLAMASQSNKNRKDGAVPSKFAQQLAAQESGIVLRIAKNPYNFEFLGPTGEVAEWNIERARIHGMKKPRQPVCHLASRAFP